MIFLIAQNHPTSTHMQTSTAEPPTTGFKSPIQLSLDMIQAANDFVKAEEALEEFYRPYGGEQDYIYNQKPSLPPKEDERNQLVENLEEKKRLLDELAPNRELLLSDLAALSGRIKAIPLISLHQALIRSWS